MFEKCDMTEDERPFDERYAMGDERPFDERYAMEEPYEPVEAYAGFVKNAKAIVYALTLCATMPSGFSDACAIGP